MVDWILFLFIMTVKSPLTSLQQGNRYLHVSLLLCFISRQSTRPPLQVLPQDKSIGSFSVYEEASINQPSFK